MKMVALVNDIFASEKIKALRFLCLTLLFLLLIQPNMISASDTCNNKDLAALVCAVPDVNAALSTLGSCFNSLDSQSTWDHTDSQTNKNYCQDNPALDPALRLANLELRLAAFEGDAGTFCCNDQECQKNCPQEVSIMTASCNADCKTAHKPGLLTTLDPVERIKNLASRLLAIQPQIECGSCSCPGSTTPVIIPSCDDQDGSLP